MPKVSPLKDNKAPQTAPAFAFLSTNVNVSKNVDDNKNVNTHSNVYGGKKEKFEDLYTRQTYYISNDLMSEISVVCGDAKGVKTKFINDAIREHLKRVKKSNPV